MLIKRAIRIGRSSTGIIIDKPICDMLGIVPQGPVEMYIDEGAVILRPVTMTSTGRLPTTHPLTMMMRTLDQSGLTTHLFAQLSNDKMPLGEFTALVERGRPVDAVTLERLKMCLSRRETCKESWDATIAAVMAVRSSSDRSDTGAA